MSNYAAQFYKSAKAGNLAGVREAVSTGVIIRDLVDPAFIEAVRANSIEVVDYLLYSPELKGVGKKNADINYQGGMALGLIVELDEMGNYLISHGINVCADDFYAFRMLLEKENKNDTIYTSFIKKY